MLYDGVQICKVLFFEVKQLYFTLSGWDNCRNRYLCCNGFNSHGKAQASGMYITKTVQLFQLKIHLKVSNIYV